MVGDLETVIPVAPIAVLIWSGLSSSPSSAASATGGAGGRVCGGGGRRGRLPLGGVTTSGENAHGRKCRRGYQLTTHVFIAPITPDRPGQRRYRDEQQSRSELTASKSLLRMSQARARLLENVCRASSQCAAAGSKFSAGPLKRRYSIRPDRYASAPCATGRPSTPSYGSIAAVRRTIPRAGW